MTIINGTGMAHTHGAHRLHEEAGLAIHVHIGGCFLGECGPVVLSRRCPSVIRLLLAALGTYSRCPVVGELLLELIR